MDFSSISIAMLGGDRRDRELASRFMALGAEVRIFGIAPWEGVPESIFASSAFQAVNGADVVVVPITGVDADSNVRATCYPIKLTQELFQSMGKRRVFVIGRASPLIRDIVQCERLKLIETAENDEIAILNSIPSAEGAIQMAMEASDITIWGSSSFVLGFGRTGVTLARMLKGIGAKTFVVARKPKDLARIVELGYEPVEFRELEEHISKADFIFNTVPAMVLPLGILKRVKKSAYILDLASSPGGVDFESAKELGLTAVLAPGLPGKVAPKTAGKILAETVPRLIWEALQDDNDAE